MDGQGPADEFSRFIRERDFAGLAQALSRRQASRGDAVHEFCAAVMAFLERGESEPMRWLDQQTPSDTALKFYTHYAMAFVAAWEGDVNETGRRLRETVRFGLAGQGVLAAEPSFRQHLYVAAQQAVYIDDTLPLAVGAAANLPGIEEIAARPAVTVLASCNGAYFDHFGPKFVASIGEHLPEAAIHIHVSNPTAVSRAFMDAAADRSWITFSRDETPEDACLFACKRLLIAHEVMRVRRSDLLISDIDVTFTEHTSSLPRLMSGQDGGLFERRHVSPMEICHCSLSYFRHTENALRFLSVLASYVDIKLRTQLRMWMLDQSALFVVSRRASKGEPAAVWSGHRNFAWCNLTEAAGRELRAFQVNQAADLDAKNVLRRWDRFQPETIGQDADGTVRVR